MRLVFMCVSMYTDVLCCVEYDVIVLGFQDPPSRLP